MFKGGSNQREQRSRRGGAVRSMLVCASALASAATIAACGSSSSSTTSSSSTGSTAGGSSATGGTLTLAYPGYAQSLDPGTGQNAYDDWVDLAYDCLFIKQTNGSFKPDLATAWSYGPNNESFTVRLRSGVRFSDGTPLTAAGFKLWMHHVLTVAGGNGPTYLGTLKSIDVTGPLSLRLEFSAPTPGLEDVLSNILEIGCPASPTAIAAGHLQTQTDGAGPYMLDTSKSVQASTYVYVKNPHYWNPSEQHWNEVVIKAITDPSSTLQALQTGEIQLATHQPISSIVTAKSEGLEVTTPMQNFYGLALLDRGGTIAKPLASIEVRQAINYAIDRPAVTSAVFGKYAQPTEETAILGDDSYVPSLQQTYSYDVAKAKALLAKAGYASGFSLTVLTSSALSLDTMAEAVAGELQKVGITVHLVDVPAIGTYIADLASGKYPAATIGFGGLPASFLYSLLWGPHAPIFNPFHTQDAYLAKLYAKLATESGTDAQQTAQAMQRYVVEQAWFAPVAENPLVAIYRTSITGVNTSPQRPIWYMPEIQPAS